MVTITWLVAHAVVGATGTEATVEFFVFEEELRSVDVSRVHLIIYIRGAKDVVDTLPLTLVAIGALNTICASGIFCEVADTLTTDLLEHRTVRTVVEVAGNEDLGICGNGTDGVQRLTEAVSHNLAKGATIAFTPIATGGMNHEDMERITRRDEP